MPAYHAFTADHDRLRAMLRAAERFVDAEFSDVREELMRARFEFARLWRRHLEEERAYLSIQVEPRALAVYDRGLA